MAAEALRRVEEEIAWAEARKAELEQLLGDPELYRTPGGHEVTLEYRSLLTELERLYAEWERLVP
ncbi:MAG: ABC transporter C-terminal domain-containing protein [Betaproteobacteria bacterium]